MDRLFELDFPYSFDPIVDQATYGVYQRLGTAAIERFLDSGSD